MGEEKRCGANRKCCKAVGNCKTRYNKRVCFCVFLSLKGIGKWWN